PVTHRFDYILGLDFGKSHDHSALALLEFRITPTSHRDGVTFAPLGQVHLRLRHLDQLPLHTDYSTVLTHLAQLLAHPALARRTALVFDANGVGAGLYEQLRDARLPAQLVPVTYTAGLKTTQSNSIYHVPKSTLITHLQTAFRQRHLAIAPALPHLDSLTQELALFERTLTASGHALYEPSKSSAHDDLLNALALANWFVHHNYQSRFRHAASGQLFLSLPNLGPF
ncbi:MAG: hypothetical protein K2Q23_02140, partial [Bryobacteraceae bacterium]|nr:hypothetical protein [Bryobacteraceae bacterium]